MTVCRAKWALNCVSNKSTMKINRREEGLGKKGGRLAGRKGACHGDLQSPLGGRGPTRSLLVTADLQMPGADRTAQNSR